MIEAESWFGEAEPCPKYLMYPGTQHLNLYLTSQLYWEPQQDVNVLLEEYYALFYGPAKEPMRNFWELSRQLYQKNFRSVLHTFSDPTNLQKISPLLSYSPEDMKQLAACLTAARDLTQADSVYRRRIETIQREFGLANKLYTRLIRKTNPVYDMASADKNPVRLVTAEGTQAEPPTWFSLTSGGNHLALTIACFEPEMDKIKANSTQNDDPAIYQDDCVEIYLAGDSANPDTCVQFLISASGKIRQVRYSREYPYGVPEPQCKLTPKVVRQANRWVVELDIPWDAFGFVPGEKKKFLMNMFRSRRVNAGAVSCWSPIVGSRFYEPESFGSVIPAGVTQPKP